MSPLRTSRQAEELSAALDGAGAPRDAQLLALVSVVERLRSVQLPRPSPDFFDQLRDHLVAAAEAQLASSAATATAASPDRRTRRSPSRSPWVRRHLGRVAGTVVVAASSVGVVAGSAQALPGDVLYPVKRAGESVELAFARGPASEGRVNLEHADVRLDEVGSLTLRDDVESAENTRLVGSTLDDFTEQAAAGGSGLVSAFEADGDRAALVEIDEFATRAIHDLQGIAASLPEDTGQQFASAAGALEVLTQEVDATCPSCPSDPAQSADLEALLETVGNVLTSEALPVSASADPVTSTPDTGTDAPGQNPGGGGSGGGEPSEPDHPPTGQDDQQVDGGGGGSDGGGGGGGGSDGGGGGGGGSDGGGGIPDVDDVVEDLPDPPDGPGGGGGGGGGSDDDPIDDPLG